MAAPSVFPVDIIVRPLVAMVRINGRDMGGAIDLERGPVSLPEGLHSIEMNVPGTQFARTRADFRVSSNGPNSFRFRVPWAPANLVVDSHVEGNVVVDGRVYSTGDLIAVPIGDTDSPERSLEIELLPPRGAPRSTRVTVRTETVTRVPAGF